MAWEPNDLERFKTAYRAGASDLQLSNMFESTPDKVGKFLRVCKTIGELPARKDFDPITDMPEEDIPEDDRDLKLLKLLKRSQTALTIDEAANALDISPKRIEEAAERLSAKRYLVDSSNKPFIQFSPPPIGKKSQHMVNYSNGNTFKFGVVSDNHLCSKYAREDVLHDLYDIFEEEGVTTVYNAGNWVDGEKNFNKQDLNIHGLGNQVNYFVKNYPSRPNIDTYYIAGDDHEGWWVQSTGVDIGQYAEDVAKRAGRTDLHYLGYMEHDVEITHPDGIAPTRIRINHPGGGSAESISHAPQKEVSSYMGGDKPHMLIMGHYHKAGYFFYRNCHILLAGCTEMQTPFMRKKRLPAHLGGWIVTIKQGEDGSILRLDTSFFPFYDIPNTDELWTYKMYQEG